MTASPTRSAAVAASVHEHAWVTASVHATSDGHVRYVRCAGCAAHRVDRDAVAVAPPTALSRTVG